MSRRAKVLLGCYGIPALVLAGSYLWLSVEHGTPELWDVVVHESGRYTLGETVLYFGHFLREVPVVLAFVFFLLGSSGGVGGRGAEWNRVSTGAGWASLAAALGLVAAALARTVAVDGWDSALLDLAQYRTRDDLVGFGTHWRYHWLSTLWFGAAAGLAPAVLNRILGARAFALHRTWMGVAWGYFALLTLVFGLSADVVLDVRYVGHQAREIMTHGPVTLLLGLGTLMVARGGRQHSGRDGRLPPGWMTGGFLALVVGIPLYLVVASLTGSVMEHGQTEQGLAAMVAAHYFEHSLDYLMALLLLVSCLALSSAAPARAGVKSSTRSTYRDHADH